MPPVKARKNGECDVLIGYWGHDIKRAPDHSSRGNRAWPPKGGPLQLKLRHYPQVGQSKVATPICHKSEPARSPAISATTTKGARQGPKALSNDRATAFCHNGCMPNEHALALRQADQARTDFALIEEHLDFI